MNMYLEQLIEVVAAEPRQEQVFAFAEEALGHLIGHKLFTVLGYEPAQHLVSRLYSSNPGCFPVGGYKLLGSTIWGQKVLIEGQPLIGKNRRELKQIFPDHKLILSLGLGSTLNIPVRIGGHTLGMLNLLHEEDYYTPEKLKHASSVAAILAPVFSGGSEILYKRSVGE